MAEQSLLGVFGPTPEQLQKLRAQQEQERSMFAARIGPSYSAGYGLGTLLGGVVGSVFGLEDPELKKARDIKNIFNEISKEGMTGDQGAMYDQLAYRLGEMGYGDEAFKATTLANEYRVAQEKRQADLTKQETDIAYKDYLIQQGKDIQGRKNIESAYNIGQGLKALSDANLPEDKFNAAYQSSIAKLDALGIDTTPLSSAENPEEQQAGIDYLINLGTSQKTRSAEAVAAKRSEVQDRKLRYQQEIDKLKLDMQKYGIDSREGIAAKNRIAALDRALITANAVDKRLGATLQGFEETSRRQQMNDIDTELQTKLDIKNLASDFELPLDEAMKAVKIYQAKVKDYFGQRDENGNFMYTLSKAQDLARQDLGKGITEGSGFLGFGKKKKVGNVKPNENKVIKLK